MERSFVALAMVFGACAEEQHLDPDVTQIQEEQGTLRVAIRKIQLASKDTVKDRPGTLTLARCRLLFQHT